MAESTEPNARTFQFVTSAQAAVDARVLLNHRINRLHLVGDSFFLVVGLALLLAGQLIGLPIAGVSGAMLAASQVQPVQRWMIARQARSLLGKRSEVTVSPAGLHFVGELATMDIPWSSLTEVRSNTRTVIFVRDRVLAGYIPASAFQAPAEQAELVRFAEGRIAGEPQVSLG